MAADAVISFSVEKLGDALIQKVTFLKGVEDEVRWLKDELQSMQCFLKDAAEKQGDNESIRKWISDIREVAQDAEDTIDTFILRVENERRSKGMMGRSSTCFPGNVYHLNRVGKEIESIRRRLDDVCNRRQMYGIQNLGAGTSTILSRRRRSEDVERQRRLYPWGKDKHLVGLSEDVELLLANAILDTRRGLSIAAIVGMGGIGKSTLARKIYNHSAVAAQFECRAWVVVSGEFRPEETIKQVMLQLQNSEEGRKKVLNDTKKLEESTSDKLFLQEKLQEKLHEQLKGKRYFVVLDDVWEHTHCEALARAFPDEQDRASRLLFTSRKEIITRDQGYIHKMKLLGPEESWELLLKTTFIGKTECPPYLVEIGRGILKKCEGLPLAITVAGGLLAKEGESKSGWEKVLKEIKNYNVGRREIDSKVSAILELSYHNLPPELKACFLCLGFFEENATIRAERLVHIWIALGLVPQEGEEMVEEIARYYLDELINGNLIQVKDMSKDDRVRTCHIHDLIRELSIRKANEEVSFEMLKEEWHSHYSSIKPRHRAMYCSGGRFIGSSTNQNKHLRSLFVHGNIDAGPSSSYWKSLELLRVLDFEGCRFGKLPEAIGVLIGLRYLGLRNTGIEKLPYSLGKLKNLEVLDIAMNYRLKVPNVLWKMDSLRHVYAYRKYLSVGGGHLKLETLKNIQTLEYIKYSDWIMVEHATEMTSLRKLGIWFDLDNVDTNKLFASLAMLENLVHLKLRWGDNFLNMNRLSALNRITRLRLKGSLVRLPDASNFCPNLSYLSLIDTDLEEDPMPVLEKLPNLLYLKLESYAYRGEEMVISRDGFPRLQFLILCLLRKLRNIRTKKGAMSELKRLKIKDCPNLKAENLPEHMRSAAITIPDSLFADETEKYAYPRWGNVEAQVIEKQRSPESQHRILRNT